MKNVLITGGAGFIGSNLALRLKDLGYTVTVLDNLSKQIHGEDAEASSLYQSIIDQVKFIKGDITNIDDWTIALKEQHIIIHLAAETGTGQSMYEVVKYVDVNVKGTAILLDLLVNTSHRVEKVIIASSRAIYGEGKYQCNKDGIVYPGQRKEEDLHNEIYEPLCPVCNKQLQLMATDEDSKIHPSSLYGITKQNQEQMVLNICSSLNIPAIAFRYQNVYGPGQSLKNPYTGILSIFSTQIRNGNAINIFEDGKESRDFVFIDDVVNATIKGIETNESEFEVFNVGLGKPVTVLEVAEKLKKHYKSDVPINITGNFRKGDIRHNYADLKKIQTRLGFSPAISFDEGLEKFTNWVLKQKVTEDMYLTSIEEMKKRGLFK